MATTNQTKTKSNRKVCSQCNKSRPTLAYAVDKTQPDNLQSNCRKCHTKNQGKAPARKNNCMSSKTLHSTMKRAAGRCEKCGKQVSKGNLQRHHLVPVCVGGNANDMSNIVTVCESCHNKYHQGENSHASLAKRSMEYRRNNKRTVKVAQLNSAITTCKTVGFINLK